MIPKRKLVPTRTRAETTRKRRNSKNKKQQPDKPEPNQIDLSVFGQNEVDDACHRKTDQAKTEVSI